MKTRIINIAKYILLASLLTSRAYAMTTEIECEADGTDGGNPIAKIFLRFSTQSLRYQYFEKGQLVSEGGVIGHLTTDEGALTKSVHMENCISHMIGDDCAGNPTTKFIDFSEKWRNRQLVVRSYVSLVESRMNGKIKKFYSITGSCETRHY